MDPLERAIRSARIQRRRPGDSATRLADMLGALMSVVLEPGHERFSVLAEAWEHVLPPEMLEHCKVAGLADGRLTVAVAGSAHRYEMQMRSAELLAELKRRCPAARLKKIELVPA